MQKSLGGGNKHTECREMQIQHIERLLFGILFTGESKSQ